MLELVSSKVVSAAAVLVLAGSVMGFFSIEKGSMDEARLRQMAAQLGDALDAVSAQASEMTLNVTFGGPGPGLRLAPSFRSEPYVIELRPGQVVLRQKGLAASHALVQEVHPWDPAILGNGTLYVSAQSLETLDSDNGVLRLWSGHDFVAERALLVVSGTPVHQTFVHG